MKRRTNPDTDKIFRCLGYGTRVLIPRWYSYCLCLPHCLQWDNVPIRHGWSQPCPTERKCMGQTIGCRPARNVC